MSISNLIGNNGKIVDSVLPNPYPFPASVAGLGQVLAVNNSALTPTGPPTPQNITDVGTLGASNIQAPFGSILSLNSDLIQNGVSANLGILPAGNLTLKGCQTKGSLLVGDGTSSKELIVPVAPALPNGSVLILDSTEPLGMKWGGEAGDINSITPGNNIDITGPTANPIVALKAPLTSTLGMGAVALTDKNGASGTSGQFLSAGTGGETLWATPAYPVVSVSAGTNINLSGTSSAPIVNFATPTTSNIELGVGTELLATSGFTTMSIDSTGLNDTYLNGLVENKVDIAVSATNVIQTISATDGSTYQNSAIVNCGTSTISDQKSATNLTTTEVGSVGITCGSTLVSMGIGCGFPSGANGSVAFQATNLDPTISLSQSAPFATSYSTIIDKNGLVQNNSSGAGFNLQTLQDLTLTCPSANKIIVPNGNDIDLSSTTGSIVHTTTYGKDGMESQDFLAATYASQAQLTQTGGNSQMTLSSSNLATASSHILQTEVSLVGNARIGHTSIGTIKNLEVQSQGYIEIKNTASNNNIFCGSGGLGIQLNSNSGNLGLNASGGSVAVSALSGVSISAGTTAGNTNSTTILNSGTGGQANPLLTLTNTNATGSVALEVYKNKPTASVGGDVLFNQSVYGKDGANNKQEYTRITHSVRDNTSGNEDGSMELSCFNAGSISTFLQLNGIENEVNCLKNLDMTGKNIITNTGDMIISTVSSTGTGNLDVKAKASSQFGGETGFTNLYNTNGNINLTAGGAVSDLVLTCPNWESATAGGNSGQHLRIKLNGVYYKIQLLND